MSNKGKESERQAERIELEKDEYRLYTELE